MTSTQEGRALATDPALHHKTSSTADSSSSAPDTVGFLSELLVASLADTLALLEVLAPADVALIDRPTAVVCHVVQQLAADRIGPDPLTVNKALHDGGHFAGHRGDLVRQRVLDAATFRSTTGLAWSAIPIAEHLLLAKLAAAGTALVTYTSEGNLFDAVAGLARDSREVARLHRVVSSLHALAEEATA